MDAKETNLFITVLLMVVLFYFSIFLFVRMIVLQNNRNIKLFKINASIAIEVMEKERARIAADLHDELGPLLAVIKFQIENAMFKTKNQLPDLSKASDHIDEVLMRLREVSYNLFPTTLKKYGLFVAISELIHSMQRVQTIKINFQYPPLLEIEEKAGIQIFRIVQEALNNVYKHAKASNINILFCEHNNTWVLACEDNGIGFDMNAKKELFYGRGLLSIQNRADGLGGVFYCKSEKGKGTLLTVEIPF